MARRIPLKLTILNKVATSTSAGVRVSDFRHCILNIIGSSNANLKVFVKGAISRGAELDTSPTFNVRSSARDDASAWDFVEVVDLEDGTAIDGDDGINLSGNVIRNVEININSFDWIAIESTAIVAGTCTVVGSFLTNE